LVLPLSRYHVQGLRIHQAQSASLGCPADGGMLRKSLADPAIFSLIGAHDDYKITTGGIIGMKKVDYNPEEAQATGKNEQLVFFPELMEDILLKFLKSESVMIPLLLRQDRLPAVAIA
jgi:hypothetical protein